MSLFISPLMSILRGLYHIQESIMCVKLHVPVTVRGALAESVYTLGL